MILHYLKVVWRNLERQKLLTLINVSGLSIGMACFSLFVLYAIHEFSYDRFHAHADNVYRVYEWWRDEGREGSQFASSTPLGPAMKSEFADVQDFVRIGAGNSMLVRTGDDVQRIPVTFADPQVFSVFTFPLISGDPKTALIDPHDVVLTASRAHQIFGRTDVIGEHIDLKTGDTFETFTISGVAQDLPSNSSIRFDILGSFNYVLSTEMGKASLDRWSMTIGIDVYVQLDPQSQLMSETERLATWRKKFFPDEGKQKKGSGEVRAQSTYMAGYGLQPLKEVHTAVGVDPWTATNPRNIYIVLGIAGSILLIACINFIILAIGRSAGRSREVGIRKVVGSTRKRLIIQFVAESIILTGLSALMGFGIAQVLLPYFNDLSGQTLSFSVLQYPELLPWLLGTVIVVGILAGSYPAFVISSFRPVNALKNAIHVAGSNLFTRSLVTFQFVISMTLIASMAVVFQQLSFLQSKDLGLQEENVVMIHAADADRVRAYRLFAQALESRSDIIGIAASQMGLGAGEGQMGRAYDFNGKVQGVIEYPIDENFLRVLDVPLLAGRNFNPAIASDTVNSVIVNESMVSDILETTPAQALGMEFRDARDGVTRTIIGVAGDFHFEPLTRSVRPQLFNYPARFSPGAYYIRITPGDPTEVLAYLESTWKKVARDVPFHYTFLDDKFDAFYASEKRWSRIIGWAGNISIFLACMGLFGLTSLAVVNRTKEIGIRKVLGASLVSIVSLLSNTFAKLILVAIALAIPLAWFAMTSWLQTFAYRIELSWWLFGGTAAIVVVIALVTVSIQALRAAWVNPVEALRDE